MLGRRNIWLYLGLLALASRILFEFVPHLADTFYRGFIFQGIRCIWDYSFGLLPFPIILLLLVILIIRLIRKWRTGKRVWLWSAVPRRMLNGLGFLFFWFMTLWGFNYQASGLVQNVENPSLNTAQLTAMLDLCCNQLERDLKNVDVKFMLQDVEPWENDIRQELVSALEARDWPVAGNVRCRVVSSTGWMRRLGIAGIYLPFSSEGHIDNSYLFSTKAFSMAHEMSHGYGVADEGEANFAALIALIHSKHRDLRLAANLELLRDVLIEMRSLDPNIYRQKRFELSQDIGRLLDDMNENVSLFPPFFPALSNFSNDMYLKIQGIEAGIESYNEYLFQAHQFLMKE